MPIDVRSIRAILDWNRRDIEAVEIYFSRKLGGITRTLFFWLEREGRRRLADYLRGLTVEGRVGWLRRYVNYLPERSRFYARAMIFEVDLREEIRRLELEAPEVKEPLELLKAAIGLKERELSFLEDLVAGLRDHVPERPGWRERVAGYLERVRKRLENLLKMVGTLTGHVYDAKTRRPIEGASVEIAGLRAITDRDGHYRIDSIPDGTHVARCLAPEYEVQEQDVEIKGGAVTTKDWFLKPVVVVPPITRVLQSRMFYRSYKAKSTPQPFAFLVVFVKTRNPEKYPEEFLKSALDFLTEDPEAFPTLGMAITSIGTLWLKRGRFTEFPAGAYFVDGREVRKVDWDEVEEEAKKFGISPEELIDQIRYTCVFYRISMGVARIYREYIGFLEYKKGRWIIHPDWGRTRVDPEETLMPEAPSVEELEL